MSTPGGSGNWGPNPYGQPQYYDPITGAPQPQGGPQYQGNPQFPGGAQPQGGQPQGGQYQGGQPQGGQYQGGQHQGGQQQGSSYQGFGAFNQQPPPQQQFGGYPQPPGPSQVQQSGRGRGPVIAAIAIAAVAVIAIATTVVVLVNNANSSDEAGPLPPSTTSPKPPASTSAAPTSEPKAGVPPVVPGWQAVHVPRRTAYYDAPLEWWVDNPDNTHGFGPADEPVTMSGVSIYQPGFCPSDAGSFRAIAGVTARKGPDDATVANETAQRLVQLAYTVNGKQPQVQFSPPTPIQIHGGRAASQVVATVTHPVPGPCDSPSVQVNIMATNSDGQTSVVFISIADQQVPGALPVQTLQQMAGTLRPDS
ncbi:hypothetical protein HUO13_08480 [Saccharopolyspora erythraea]|uniref:hypothetical protein n=1 Tax=Saccharopolyspora erythraea TaxID=1836 RepID=UPI001BA9171B|nr:hypothetical protein [Saccharopolyspora erythraea]QUH00850.1 hypothetical protein HUO13_08480 [Saccharopolyspora erythraea]